jgi:hypothetical protein
MMQHSAPMQSPEHNLANTPVRDDPSSAPRNPGRRRLLKLGLGASAVVAVAGTGALLWSPGWRDGHLTAGGRAVFRAAATAVLEGLLPTEATTQNAALDAHLLRVDATLAALPRHTQAELAQLLGLLQLAPVRRWLCGLEVPWQQADLDAARGAIKRLHGADDELRQQVFHALRDLTAASYVAAPEVWPLMGYPGPTVL